MSGSNNRPPTPPAPISVERTNLNAPAQAGGVAEGRTLDMRIFNSAQKRFQRAKTYYHNTLQYGRDDLKFDAGDAYNGYQWPVNIRMNRERDQKPTLTLNRTRQHNLLIINDMKQNSPGIDIRPTGNEATLEAAECLKAVIRGIEYRSRARSAYNKSAEFQVKTGYGVIRVDADYISDDSFDQDAWIRPVLRPDLVYIDPDCKQPDRSDANWAFVFDEIPVEDFADLWPEYAGHTQVFSEPAADWVTKTKVRVAEYFYRQYDEDELVEYIDTSTGKKATMRKSKMNGELWQELVSGGAKTRKIKAPMVKWALIIGTNVADKADIPCSYIPLVPVLGEETYIDNQYDRKGHTRAMIDPQRMYNYWSSQAVEQAVLQSKTPWIAPALAIEGQEVYWNTANQVNYSVLVWNHRDDEGNEIPAPIKNEPPNMAPAYLQGMQVTQQEMMMVSGQFQAQMGEPSNERSGTSIQQRQRQGDTATYHFIDNQAMAIRQVGKIILDMIPRLYDSTRVVMALGENGISYDVEMDPQAQQAYMKHLDHDNKVAKHVLNPNIGMYEVQAEVGPNWGTRREQTVDVMGQILTQNPALTQILGDIFFQNLDISMADEAAARLRRGVPKELLGEGPSQQEQALAQQLQETQGLLQKIWQQHLDLQMKHNSIEAKRDIDAYDAETKRVAALSKIMPTVDPQGTEEMVKQLIADAHQTHIVPLIQMLTKKLAPEDVSPEDMSKLMGMTGP